MGREACGMWLRPLGVENFAPPPTPPTRLAADTRLAFTRAVIAADFAVQRTPVGGPGFAAQRSAQ